MMGHWVLSIRYRKNNGNQILQDSLANNYQNYTIFATTSVVVATALVIEIAHALRDSGVNCTHQ